MVHLFENIVPNNKNKGFALIEVLVVLVIICIITISTGSIFVKLRRTSEKRVCETNCNTVERTYELDKLNNDFGEISFDQFIIENFDNVCPTGGLITYDDGKVNCSLHNDVNEKDENTDIDEEVPWL